MHTALHSATTRRASVSRWHLILGCVAALWLSQNDEARGCPFCSAVSQTLRQEMEVMDAVVIASATHGETVANRSTGETTMRIEKVLAGNKLVSIGEEVTAIYYGEVELGRRFMLSGVDPENLQWSCLPLTERAEAYVIKVVQLAEADPVDRLRFHMDYLQDDESMLSRDAYDEFAIAPYEVIKKLGPRMDHDQLVGWLGQPDLSTDRKRLYLTMLGVCGSKDDLPMLEKMLRSTSKSSRSGLDALIACYLVFSGEEGLSLIDELFLDNKDAPYADTYAAILAIRFHGTEGDTIPRSALAESLHHILDRQDLADLVISDLARWQDWSQIDRLTEMFLNSDPDNNWIRVPVINYLRACPLDEAKQAIAKLKEVDPASVKRANTFFSIPIPAREVTPAATDASMNAIPASPNPHRGPFSDVVSRPLSDAAGTHSDRPTAGRVVGVGVGHVLKPGRKLASATGWSAVDPLSRQRPRAGMLAAEMASPGTIGTAALAESLVPMNPLKLGFVIAVVISSFMIAQFLMLTGGSLTAHEASVGPSASRQSEVS